MHNRNSIPFTILLPGTYELPTEAVKEHETLFNDNPNYVIVF